jgi:mannosyltransferase OCH1-like enzyme
MCMAFLMVSPGAPVAHRECQRLHPGYEFKLWTDASARELVAKEYPEYLQMYDGYGYGIQVSSTNVHNRVRVRPT